MFGRSGLRNSRAVGLIAFFFFLIAASSHHAQSPITAIPRKGKPGLIKHLYSFTYGEPQYGVTAKMAFDASYAFVMTPGGLYRAPLPLNSKSHFELIGFQGTTLTNMYVNNGVLYVLKFGEATQGGPATDHTFLRSFDHGQTFFPIDGNLQECLGGYCSYMIPDKAAFRGNLVYLNAGGAPNLQFSNNGGASWTPLLGGLQSNVCYLQSFELIGTRVIVGGECPLDSAYIRAGTLRPDMMGWVQTPTAVNTPPLANRNVQFIRNKPNTNHVFIGVEGGLLKSTDAGQNFRFVLEYTTPPYPYIHEIFFAPNMPGMIVAGGDGNCVCGPFLAVSSDNGETWYDITSRLLPFAGPPGKPTALDSLGFIEEGPDGRIYVGIIHAETNTMIIVQLRLEIPMLRP